MSAITVGKDFGIMIVEQELLHSVIIVVSAEKRNVRPRSLFSLGMCCKAVGDIPYCKRMR